MATIPQVIDYGARPSLRSSRVDVPGTGDVAVADAIVRAADTFTRVVTERKVKQDAFNYNMAKQEYLTADLDAREKLQDDRDYDTFDSRYRGWLKEDRGKILSKYELTPHDKAIFNAEADLIRERGAASVGEFRRRVMIDDKLADLEGSLIISGEKVQLAPPMERAEIMLTALDQINAAEDDLILSDVDAEKMRQKFVQGVALKTLVGMDPDQREKVLEASLAYRRATGEPLSADEIREGKGTGSIADFLHTDTLNRLLEQTKKENEINNAQAEGYAAKDKAWDLYKGLDATSRRKRAEIYRAMDSPQARNAAEAADARQLLLDAGARNEGYRQIESELRRMIDDYGMSWDELAGALRSQLPPERAAATEAYARRVREGEGFNDHVTAKGAQTYRDMTPQQRADFKSEEWMPQVIPLAPSEKWSDHIDRSQADHWDASAQQLTAQLAVGKPPETGIPLQAQMDAVFGRIMKKPTATSDKELIDQWNRMELAYHNAVIRAGGEGKLTPLEKSKIMNDVIKYEVFERQTFFWIDQLNPDDLTQYATMTAEQIQKSYLPLDHKVPPTGQTAHTMEVKWTEEVHGVPDYNGYAIDWLKNVGSMLNPENPGQVPPDEVLEEAFFYLVTQGPLAAQQRLAGVKGF
jgi:hypothetical protein